MKTRYYLFGGRPAAPAYRWKGYTLPGLTRVAADTRGLSGEETEFLPYRASGPEPLDPGEGGTLEGIPIWDGLSDNEKKLAVVAAASAAAWFLFGKKVMRKNPTKRSKSKSKKMYVLVWDGESFGEVSGAFAVSRSKKTIDQAVEYWRDYGVPTKVVRK